MEQSIMAKQIKKALAFKIEKVEKFINWQQNIIDQAEAQLKKKGKPIPVGGGFTADMVADDDFWTKSILEATEKRDQHLIHLANYKRAQTEFDGLIKLVAGIKDEMVNTEEGSTADVLDETINDCLDMITEWKKAVNK
jgi:hypothetical protein